MYEFTIIKDIVVILLVSIPIILLFNKLKLPSIAGFLIAGMIIGPFGFKLIANIDEINIMAEIGVILLLFTIGLEFSLKELAKMKKLLLFGGGLQVLITILATAILLYSFGMELRQAIFFGMLVSLSSTAIVLKLLSDRGELQTPQGKISVGILIFQDLAIVPMFLLVDILGTSGEVDFISILIRLFTAIGVIAFILFAAKYLSPKLLYYLARTRIRELFTVGIILILLGTAYLTHNFGLSFALGAFIAGLILSESEYSTQITAEIIPFKDVFNSIFFVSVGLLLNINYVINFPVEVVLSAVGIIILKSLIIFVLVLSMKYPSRIAILSALGLAQIGEFSFILAQQGGKLLGDYSDILLSSAIITMIITPLLIRFSVLAADKSKSIKNVQDTIEEKGKFDGHVIIAGFGLNGRNLAHVLKETGINYIVIEMNPDTVKKERAKGENIIFGDISREEVLQKARIKTAKVIVVAISDRTISRKVIRLAKQMNKEIFVLIRTRFVEEIEDLTGLGADAVIPEEFETSIQIFRRVLLQYHIPLNVVMQQVNMLRGESYKWLRSEKSSSNVFSHLDEILAAGIAESFYLNEENINTGKTIAELNIRAKTDATVLAIIREGKTISNPSASEKLLSGDTLVITGTHKAVDSAFNLLSGKTS
ncbi:MAG: cation:proton antiporter [Ignavibacteriaceae bacterium]|nr:cation:proton antiporter [Ignavibacteriaceae bacterium]